MITSQHITLELVANEFNEWRKTKKPGEHIPNHLWQLAKRLTKNYRVSHIARALRISAKQYYRSIFHVMPPSTRKTTALTRAANTFVKVENPLCVSSSEEQRGILHVEFIRKDGARLNCYYPNLGMLHNTVKWFMEES